MRPSYRGTARRCRVAPLGTSQARWEGDTIGEWWRRTRINTYRYIYCAAVVATLPQSPHTLSAAQPALLSNLLPDLLQDNWNSLLLYIPPFDLLTRCFFSAQHVWLPLPTYTYRPATQLALLES
ncbi:hypothetical protein K431DRAFT_7608 [Polychaeton citri CBS 116435]|uniref:Uncharacterized protein n=1 Tax=Polychaeton citri CBS 116435 TaxID=1314669 RepID=A0A9P4QFI6_9PEZI|nr:hypothetical protein K431DRAFT_7608 [Polychaeton citri CBS 116435]